MRARKLVLGGLMVVLLLGLVGCGDSDSSDSSVLGSRRSADLVVTDTFPFYAPTRLEITLNKEVTFRVFNDGTRLHNITIPGLDIDVDIAAGQSADIKLPAVAAAPRDGFFTVYCKYHQSEGESFRLTIVS